MAAPKKNNNNVTVVQTPNASNNWSQGNSTYAVNGLPVSTAMPSAYTPPKAPSGTAATASPTTAGWDSQINRPVATMGVETSTGYVAPLAGEPMIGIQMPVPKNQKKSVPYEPEEEKKRSGGGGSTLPNLPAELANQIADAYARSQGTGPDAWQNRYQAEIDGMRGQRYGDYDSQYIPQINGLVDRLLNRDSFSYNWSDDPLYRQYAARYQQAARQGMQDTMGQAAAMTGGYGNSYATAAANQAYANQMAGLNDRAMDLYQLAAENYDRDTNNLRSNLQQLEQREAANRGNYDTDRAVFYDRQDADLNNLLNQQAMDYQVWADEVARDQAERNMAWQQYAYWNDLYHNKYNYKG